MNNKLTLVVAATAVVGLIALASPAFAQTTVTAFAPSANTTSGVWFENDVRPGGTASIADLTGLGGDLENNQPLPIGAALLTTDFTNEAKAEVGVLNSYGMPDDIFATLSIMYSYHKATNAGQSMAAAPSLKLTFWNAVCDDTPSGDCYATLVYEPYWNGSNGPGVVTAPATDLWTAVSIDDTTGVFWTSGGFGFANSYGGPPLKTLAEWHTALSSDFGDAELILVSVGVGSYNQGQIAYFDDVQISHNFGAGFSVHYDFEIGPPDPSTVLSHFTIYDVKPEPVEGGGGMGGNELNIGVTLEDQFGTSLQTVKKAKILLVPVSKNGEEIVDGVSHLVCYEIKTQDPEGGMGTGIDPAEYVEVVNQFTEEVGAQVMEVKKLKYLCVPSTKEVVDPPVLVAP